MFKKYTSCISRTHNFVELPSCNNVKQCISHILRNPHFKLPSCNVPSFCPLRRHLRNTHVFLPSCALNIRSSSSTAASPEVHRSKVFRATEGFTESSRSSFVHFIHRAVDYSREYNSTYLYMLCNNTQFPNRPPYLLLPQHTAAHAQSCTLDMRRYLFVPSRLYSRSYFAVTYRNPAAIFYFLTNRHLPYRVDKERCSLHRVVAGP